MSSADEEVVVEGGPLDGLVGTIGAECSHLGFFVHIQGDFEYEGSGVWGYFAHERNADGVRVFRPGAPTDGDGSHQ
jgi:hypothetical protein